MKSTEFRPAKGQEVKEAQLAETTAGPTGEKKKKKKKVHANEEEEAAANKKQIDEMIA
jgi:hypothetical protein